MNIYNLKFRLFNSSSGVLYLIEEQSDQKITKHYAYNLSDQFKESYLQGEANIKNCSYLRKHLKEISIQNKRYIVFEYLEGHNLESQIKILKGKKEGITHKKINNYLTQMLEALYQLHSQLILGRVFSTKNIMDCNGQLLFLDFGYGPQLTIDNLDLCAPPELIENLAQKNAIQQYSMKIDSWLLGAVLYHLVKYTPINSIQIDNERVKIMNPENIGEYLAYLKRKMEDSICIEVKTSRFSIEFCSFVEGLLTYNVDKRLSFSQIYHHQFIQSLNLPNYNQYLAFYEQFDENTLIQQIQIVENHDSQILATNNLQVANTASNNQQTASNHLQTASNHYQTASNNQYTASNNQYTASNHYQTASNNQYTASNNQQTASNNQQTAFNLQQIPPLRITSTVGENLNSIQFPKTSSRTDENFQGSEDFNIEKYFPFEILDRFNHSKFYEIFQYVRMEQFRFIFLEKTADEMIFELSKKKFQLEYVCAYFFRKMAYLILIELLKKLNEDVCPWKGNCADRWKDFQKEKQKELLVMNLKKKMADAEKLLKQLFYEKCQHFIKDERVEKCVRDSLQADQIILEKLKIDGSSIYNQYSEDFLKSGYRQLIFTTYKFLDRERMMALQPEIKYNSIQLKILLCHLINRIFDLTQLSIFLQNFLQKGRKLITPNELYSYICKDDEIRKEKEIKDILNEYFKIQ